MAAERYLPLSEIPSNKLMSSCGTGVSGASGAITNEFAIIVKVLYYPVITSNEKPFDGDSSTNPSDG